MQDMGSRYEVLDRVILTVIDKNGNIKYRYDSGYKDNGITNVGLLDIAILTGGVTPINPYRYIAIGTGTQAFDPSQTALQTEVKRKLATNLNAFIEAAGGHLLLETTFASVDGLTGTQTITESGVFNASTGGSMLARQVFTGITLNWDIGDRLDVKWDILFRRPA